MTQQEDESLAWVTTRRWTVPIVIAIAILEEFQKGSNKYLLVAIVLILIKLLDFGGAGVLSCYFRHEEMRFAARQPCSGRNFVVSSCSY